ncbi:hypothetical protein NEAUS03_2329 [Nematocida ausubeli]|nr:hypothetical protein NEAUS03_2329 [Nematocida ausubeli]
MLIGLAILCHVWDRIITVERLRSVYIMADVITKGKNANSRVASLLKEEASDIGFIHSKRFFSPEIKIEHSIVVTKDDSEDNSDRYVPKDPIYTYTRDYRLDRVHPTLPYEGDFLKYKQEYFNTLLELFPSMHGYVSMWSDREDSFFSFINSPDVKEHKYTILASLLLLAEGIDVPLEVDESKSRTELVLKKVGREEEHFRLNMNVLVKTGKNAESLDVFEKVFQKQAVDVVNFFIENRENKVFTEKEDFLEPFLCKQFEKVQFINSPAFLIQTYIRHCLENVWEVISFRWVVRDLLSEYMGQEEANPEKKQRKQTLAAQAKDLYSRYFIPGEQRSNDPQSMNMIRQMNVMMFDKYRNISINPLYLEPAADVVPVRKNIKNLSSSSSAHRINPLDDKHIQKNANPIRLPGFTDYGETALLGLFCTIAYDPKKNIYTVDHIESASKELKSFFRKHKYMYGVVSKSMHDDWNQVVGYLSNPNIQYMRSDRNQLVPGWINMLYVIKEITGVGDTKKINEFRKKLSMIAEEQKIWEVRMLYETLEEDAKATKEEKDGIKLQILEMIDVKRLKTIRILEEKLKKEKNREEAAAIELEMQKLMDIKALYESYIEKEEALKTELSKDIEEYLTETIKKASKFTISIFKQTCEECCSDLLGELYIDCTTESSYYYQFVASFNYNPKMIELECRPTFTINQELCSLENKRLGVFERNALVRAIDELERE